MLRLSLVVIIVAILSVLLGVFLIPGDDELALMKFKDGELEQALIAYEKKREEGDVSPLVLRRLSDLYLASENPSKAAESYAAYISETGEDVDKLEYLSTLYLQSENLNGYVSVVGGLYRLRDDRPALENLADAYEMFGDFGKLSGALAQLEQRYGLDLEGKLKLADSYAISGDLVSSDKIFRTIKLKQVLELSLDQQLIYYQIAHVLSAKRQVIPVLENLVSQPNVDEVLIDDLVTVYQNTHQVNKGVNYFASLRSSPDRFEIDFAWARLAVATDRSQDVNDWLFQQPELSQKHLESLYYPAAKNRDADLAISLARRIEQISSDKKWKKVLLDLLAEKNQSEDAIVLADQLHKDGELSTRQFEYYLEKLASDSSLNRYYKQQALDGNLGAVKRLQYIDVLLARGRKDDAIASLWRMADRETANSTITKKLLYLWGPLAGANELNWLVGRAEQADVENKGYWFKHLVNAGGTYRLPQFLSPGWRVTGTEQDLILIESLVDKSSWGEASKWIGKAGALDRDLKRLRRYAWWMEKSKKTDLSAALWQRILSIYPEDTDAQRWLGSYWWKQRQADKALSYLLPYTRSRAFDVEVVLLLSEIYQEKAAEEQERSMLRRALSLLVRRSVPQTLKVELTKAQIYERLDRKEEAIGAYSHLYKRYPDNQDIRASYASLLLQSGRVNESKGILGL